MVVSKLGTLLNSSLTVKQAKQIHALVLVNGLNHLEPLVVRQVLVSTCNYSESTTHYVKLILFHMQNPDVFSWSCTVRFLSQHAYFREAFALYVQMQRLGLCPSSFALSSSLKACARLVYKMAGISIHAQVHKCGFCKIVYVQTALVDFYSKLRNMETARKVFDEMVEKNVVSWNSMLSGYLKSGDLTMAHSLFDEIPKKDVVSWNSMVSGFARAGNMEQACALFRQMPERNTASWNAMVSGYLECGKRELARSFFDAMPTRNSVSWITMISGYSKGGDVESAQDLFDWMGEKDLLLYNAMISCYAQNGRSKEALQLFNKMLQPDVNIQPDKMTFASVISACSQMGDLSVGSQIESTMNRLGIRMDNHLATALIDLYAKSGRIDKAYVLFHGLQKKDLISYTAMILGCGLNGRANDSIKLFEEMMDTQIYPNLVTFTGILTAYNHVGLVEEGYKCFTSMQKHGLMPSADHYGIMVDLFGRAGRLKEAYELIKNMPMQPHAGVWGALLLACSVHNNVELAEIAAKHCFALEPDTTGYRSLLASIYASVGRWDDAKRLRKGLQEKIPGCSWMEHN
ncbi:pentatricopeptide repeat-containing protein At4g22760 [Actinidia eriantha]|uniref:pentatricopeptide repeat-containing protein At4g22760 n=1 Tax=Actinidia eriantha TaxID=165200 RepID=UPI0025848CAB|nr:pentatricopeptide repeat-containing protein At4g22760 [Actinidia eriantha]XP_057510446.1 pentatricopeptide repeat-containing protein At4g22760 [Actinidia eriantha]XP_057510447.1 pentatricopeptide repeat-containing protein At4g22760 [Actinidia eriantha]XP_057510448.1 pentatricopeptide repeat-containing protein At4g22760 [Actinidia eriantha]